MACILEAHRSSLIYSILVSILPYLISHRPSSPLSFRWSILSYLVMLAQSRAHDESCLCTECIHSYGPNGWQMSHSDFVGHQLRLKMVESFQSSPDERVRQAHEELFSTVFMEEDRIPSVTNRYHPRDSGDPNTTPIPKLPNHNITQSLSILS